MDNIDEKIAKLKMQQRIEKEKELHKEANEEKAEEKVTLEDVVRQIVNGSLYINGTNFKFVKKIFLDGKLEIPMPLSYFNERVNTKNNTTLVNDNGVSFNLSYVEKGAQKQSFAKFKKGMEKNLKDMNFYLEWIEEGELGENSSRVFYGIYKTPTSRGDIYNLIFYREHKGTLIIGNYNCFYRDIKTWGLLIKASIILMKIN